LTQEKYGQQEQKNDLCHSPTNWISLEQQSRHERTNGYQSKRSDKVIACDCLCDRDQVIHVCRSPDRSSPVKMILSAVMPEATPSAARPSQAV
jgi:hypothetical protein